MRLTVKDRWDRSPVSLLGQNTGPFQLETSTIGSTGMAEIGGRIEQEGDGGNPAGMRAALGLKRAADIAISSALLIGLAPALGILWLAVRLSSPGPAFYGQRRIGAGNVPFTAWKFRSMRPDADAVLERHLMANPALRAEWDRDHKLKNDPRVTAVGRLLRKTSLDELPQLWNVLRGDMSTVGPRPIVPAEVAKYGETFDDYIRVRPGITGLWQISGRNNTTYAERVAFDSYYVKNWSLLLDGRILLRTIKTVIFAEGAY